MSVEDINSLHLWLCSQPAEFDPKTALNKYLTPSQNEECKQLAKLAYFGWKSNKMNFWTLDRNLPCLYRSFGENKSPRCIFLAKTKPPSVGLGTLNRLPLEILNHIISSLDISALDQFKAVNRRGFEAVNANPQFKVVNRQAHDILCGLRAIKTGHTMTVKVLFEKLCASQCNECGDYGGYIYLVTFQRVCCRCFTEKDRYSPLREIDALRKFGLTLEILRTLPRFLGYPGYYGDGCFGGNKQDYISLIDRESAYGAGIAHHGSLEAMQEYVANADPNVWKSYKKEIEECNKKLAAERAVKARKDKAKRKAEDKKRNAHKKEVLERREERERRIGNATAGQLIPYCHPGPQIEDVENIGEDTDNESISTFAPDSDTDKDTNDDSKDIRSDTERREAEATSSEDSGEDDDIRSWTNEPLRYMAMMRVPWLNRRSRRDEWGFHCVGCEDLRQWPNHARRDFIMSTFREHLKECGPIKDGVHHINDCCKKGTCRKKEKDIFPGIYERPFWRC